MNQLSKHLTIFETNKVSVGGTKGCGLESRARHVKDAGIHRPLA